VSDDRVRLLEEHLRRSLGQRFRRIRERYELGAALAPLAITFTAVDR
jgi:hypothetical protein